MLQLQVKLGALIFLLAGVVVAAIPERDDGLDDRSCEVVFDVVTAEPTDSDVMYVLQDGGAFIHTEPGSSCQSRKGHCLFVATSEGWCGFPCRLVLQLHNATARWLPLSITVEISKPGRVPFRTYRTFPVGRWVNGSEPLSVSFGECKIYYGD